MSEAWDPLRVTRGGEHAPRREDVDRLRSADGMVVRQGLRALAEREFRQASYTPGDLFDVAAYREGRKAVWRELMRWMDE